MLVLRLWKGKWIEIEHNGETLRLEIAGNDPQSSIKLGFSEPSGARSFSITRSDVIQRKEKVRE